MQNKKRYNYHHRTVSLSSDTLLRFQATNLITSPCSLFCLVLVDWTLFNHEKLLYVYDICREQFSVKNFIPFRNEFATSPLRQLCIYVKLTG